MYRRKEQGADINRGWTTSSQNTRGVFPKPERTIPRNPTHRKPFRELYTPMNLVLIRKYNEVPPRPPRQLRQYAIGLHARKGIAMHKGHRYPVIIWTNECLGPAGFHPKARIGLDFWAYPDDYPDQNVRGCLPAALISGRQGMFSRFQRQLFAVNCWTPPPNTPACNYLGRHGATTITVRRVTA